MHELSRNNRPGIKKMLFSHDFMSADSKGFTLIELLTVIAIIAILAAISIPAYLGQATRAARSEAFTDLQSLWLLEEQFFSENGAYTADIGTCAADNPGNLALIKAVLPGFKPSNTSNFSFCLEQDEDIAGADTSASYPCFAARAYGDTGTRVAGDVFDIDCNNDRTF